MPGYPWALRPLIAAGRARPGGRRRRRLGGVLPRRPSRAPLGRLRSRRWKQGGIARAARRRVLPGPGVPARGVSPRPVLAARPPLRCWPLSASAGWLLAWLRRGFGGAVLLDRLAARSRCSLAWGLATRPRAEPCRRCLGRSASPPRITIGGFGVSRSSCNGGSSASGTRSSSSRVATGTALTSPARPPGGSPRGGRSCRPGQGVRRGSVACRRCWSPPGSRASSCRGAARRGHEASSLLATLRARLLALSPRAGAGVSLYRSEATLLPIVLLMEGLPRAALVLALLAAALVAWPMAVLFFRLLLV